MYINSVVKITNPHYTGDSIAKILIFYLKPFRGNNNIINLNTSYEKNVQLSSNKYLLLLLLYIYKFSKN